MNLTAEAFRKLPLSEREKRLSKLTPEEILHLKFDWPFWARPEQLCPPDLGKDGKFIWFAKAGRGAGKTRQFAEWVIDNVQNHGYRHVSIVGAAADEVRDIQIEGESGIMACSPPWFYPLYEPSKKRLTWPNGAVGHIYYGSEPDKSRGAQSDLIWCDEIVKWKYPIDTFDNLMYGLRLGTSPLCGVSSTPKPTKLIKDLIARPDCIVTSGSTFSNKDNLSDVFISAVVQKYDGTRLGRQELYAEILDDNPNALWLREWLDEFRVSNYPTLSRVVVGVDPPASENGTCGIVVCGEVQLGRDFHYYVLDDMSIQGRPSAWASQAIAAYNKYKANFIIAEKNNGGDMVKSTLHNVDNDIPVILVWASRGKYTRAEPISLLYEQGYVHHVGAMMDLEDQLCEWEPGDESPDRLDANVWGLTYLYEKRTPKVVINTDQKRPSRAINLPT